MECKNCGGIYKASKLCLALFIGYGKEHHLFRETYNYKEDTDYYDYYYYRRSYGSLRDLLTLYHLPEHRVYGKYWEVIHAYEALMAYEDYTLAARAGEEYAEGLAEAEREKFKEIQEKSRYSENAVLIGEMAERLEAF